MNRFQDKNCIVTGAGTGIGLEIASRLISEGAFVLLNDKNAQLLEETTRKLGKQCLPYPGDASQVSFIYQMVDHLAKLKGTVDYVVANAGITIFQPFLEFQEDHFEQIMQLNVKGTYFLCQAFAKQQIKQEKKGSILLMASNIGFMAFPNLSAYSISKAAIRQMARNLVAELSPLGIRINAVAPGATLTERTEKEEENYWETWSKITPLNQIATKEDVAQSSLFLLSDQAKHITGQTLVIDGGWEANGLRPNGEHVKVERKFLS